MSKEKFEPKTLFVDQKAIDQEKQALENYLDAVNNFAKQLEEEQEIQLDENLLQEFSEIGHPAISRRIMTDLELGKKMKLIYSNFHDGAIREAKKFTHHFQIIHREMLKSGFGIHSIAILNGRAIPRGGVLEEIATRNTVVLKDPQQEEVYNRVKAFAASFMEFQAWMKGNAHGVNDVRTELITAFTDTPFVMDSNIQMSQRDDVYLIDLGRDGETDLQVNPLFFK